MAAPACWIPAEAASLSNLPPGMTDAAQMKGGRRAEAWILITVEEAYIHCSKHVPLLTRLNKQISWGTDDERLKGGNFFKVRP